MDMPPIGKPGTLEPTMKLDKRTRARELAMQALYQLDIQGSELLHRLPSEFFKVNEPDDYIGTLAFKWTEGTWTHISLCDDLISSAVIRWNLSRLSPVDKSILRLAVYQLMYCQDIPPKVVINEAIELAKNMVNLLKSEDY